MYKNICSLVEEQLKTKVCFWFLINFDDYAIFMSGYVRIFHSWNQNMVSSYRFPATDLELFFISNSCNLSISDALIFVKIFIVMSNSSVVYQLPDQLHLPLHSSSALRLIMYKASKFGEFWRSRNKVPEFCLTIPDQ